MTVIVQQDRPFSDTEVVATDWVPPAGRPSPRYDEPAGMHVLVARIPWAWLKGISRNACLMRMTGVFWYGASGRTLSVPQGTAMHTGGTYVAAHSVQATNALSASSPRRRSNHEVR